MAKKSAVKETKSPQKMGKIKSIKGETMTTFKLNKIALCATMSVFLGGCALFGLSSFDGAKGKLGEGQSVCNTLSKGDIFPTYYQSIFKDIGSFVFSGQYTIAQVENLLGAQVHYMEFKRSNKESVCAYIMATNTAYKQVSLTSQDIANLERILADNDAYSEYEKRKEVKDKYYTAMKFLKYHNRLATPQDSLGLRSLRDLGELLWKVDKIDNPNTGFLAKNITATKFLYSKAQNERVYKDGALSIVGVYTDIHSLSLVPKSGMMHTKQPCAPLSNTECSMQINEIREIKNYAESLLK